MEKRSILFFTLFLASFFAIHHWFGPKSTKQAQPTAQTVIVKEEAALSTNAPVSHPQGNETFYVLENGFQQLVFSNRGAAIAEINLPFNSKENPRSVVKEIEFDKTLQKKYPQNDYFPQHSYYSVSESGSRVLNNQGKLGNYYPLLRRSLYTSEGDLKKSFPAKFYALNTVGEGTEDLLYQVTNFQKDQITFEGTLSGGRKIVKTYSFPKDKAAPYCFELTVRVEGNVKNLWMGTGVPEVELISGSFTPALKYRSTRGAKSSVEKLKNPSDPIVSTSLQPDWISNSNGFFGVIIDPLTKVSPGYKALSTEGASTPTRLSLIDPASKLYPADKYPGYNLLLPLKAEETMKFRVFAGPYEDDILTVVDETYASPQSGYDPDYSGAQSFHGWFSFISEPFAKFLFFLMNIFHELTNSWGFSIILLTIVLRLMLYPLNAWSIKSSMRMQQIAPQVKAIQEKYKKDPKKAQMEIMNLYRHSGANPFMGCFPILIQMPFLIGMFDLLKSTFELRGAPFIPGWIDNLTAPDVLFSWNTPIFFIGTQFHLLPILLGAVMLAQQKITAKMTGTDKGVLTDQQKQQRMMGNIMVIVFTVLFYSFPSGLNIYWLSSMLLGILQQWIMKKKVVLPAKKLPMPVRKK
jgi:YidC/Oxa1 family membrane protein insertase